MIDVGRRLRQARALRGMAPADRIDMAEYVRIERFRGGVVLCSEGEEGERAWLVLGGTVRASSLLPDGGRVELAELTEGAWVGESGLLRGQARTAEFRAETEVELVVLTRRDYEFALRRGQPWARWLQRQLGQHLAAQLRSALQRLERLAQAEDKGQAVKVTAPKIPVLTRGPSDSDIVRRKEADEEWQRLLATSRGRSRSDVDLLRLLARTEAGLSMSSGEWSDESVRVVYDED